MSQNHETRTSTAHQVTPASITYPSTTGVTARTPPSPDIADALVAGYVRTGHITVLANRVLLKYKYIIGG